MNYQGGSYEMVLPAPTIDLSSVFADIKAMQKDNLNDVPIEFKDDKNEEEIRGLKFIAKKIKTLLQKNKRIQYNQASRILINNFANEEKDERNIKRRVYDAINVLVSAGVIIKDDSKLQLVNQKRQAQKQNRNLGSRLCKQQFPQTIELVKNRLEQKKRKLRILKQRKTLLKRIFIKCNKKSKKQQTLAFFWQGNVSQVKITKKKDIIVVIQSGKMKQSPSSLLNQICYIDPQLLKQQKKSAFSV